MRTMYDAAFPPKNPPQHDAIAGYIGGNTPHVWTVAEWEDQTAKSGARFWLPIYVRSNPGSHDPFNDAAIACNWLLNRGMPEGMTLALDYETAVNANYLEEFDGVVSRAGWRVAVYGSISTVRKNPEPSGGYWIADWTGRPHIVPGSVATQWSGSGPFGGAYDPNLVADSMPLWQIAGENLSANGPENWDRADFDKLDTHLKAFMVERLWPEHSTISEMLRDVLPGLSTIRTMFANLPQQIVAALPAGAGTTTYTLAQIQGAAEQAIRNVLGSIDNTL
jgi:hypothetical protein